MFLTNHEARSLDRRAIEEFGVPSLILMENAGRNMAELLRTLGIQGTVVICCGKGNNGGDGFVIARHLDNAGVNVRVLLFARPADLRDAAAANYHILERSGIPLSVFDSPGPDEHALRQELSEADWVVDALFGSGLRGPLPAPFDRVVHAIDESGARVFAVDIPSGLDGDTGKPSGPTVRAHHTAAIIAPRIGYREPSAREWLGRVHVIDIGMPRRILQDFRA